jgi:hypothetical protein
MTLVLIVVLVLALFAAVFALAREIRLRKALMRMLQHLLFQWRVHDTKQNSQHRSSRDLGPDLDEWL